MLTPDSSITSSTRFSQIQTVQCSGAGINQRFPKKFFHANLELNQMCQENLDLVKKVLTYSVIFSAVISGILWSMSARVTVLAKDQNGGYGAMLGGDLIAQGENGERINLHATMVEQSRLNRWAAYCAAICAFLQAVQLYVT